MIYNHNKIEKKWIERWEKEKTNSPNLKTAKNKYYNLMMFPYPSAEGLHVGNMYAFTGSDIWGRYKRMRGFSVFEPIGLDGFGIHSENYAIKIKEHIRDVSKRTEKHFYQQLRMLGNQFDFTRKVETYNPNYYKWTQWLFIQMFKKGLAYRKTASVNWCPSCKTVLSDEQVISGKCERCNSEVEKKNMEQWFWKITKYADKLLKNLEWIDWPKEVKTGQKNWIGKSEGINITYKIKNSSLSITVYTTRPDTNFGATFIVCSPESDFIQQNIDKFDNQKEIKEYIKKAIAKMESERIAEGRKKTGIFTGLYAINNFNKKEMPIFVSDFVLANVGTGNVVGVPGHDKRDFEFAKEKGIEIIRVVVGEDGDKSKITKIEQVHESEGIMINSGFLDGLSTSDAREKIMDFIEEKGFGKRTVNYKLRDWCISRQRYWGPPIPMIFCQKCGWNPVKEEDLPVMLPEIKEFKDILPDGSGKGPLAKQKDFIKTKCPICARDAERETDVSDPFVDSCWYFLRYPSTEYTDRPFDKKITKKWLPVDMYIGGKEHTVLHLLYARFITMVLKDMGYIDFEEPFTKFIGHGLLIKDGAKMSKSKGNVINPDEYINKFGADSVRMYLMFLGNFELGGDWRDSGMNGMYKFVKKVFEKSSELIENARSKKIQIKNKISYQIHRTVKKITDDIERLSYNTAISQMMIFFNSDDWKKIDGKEKFVDLDALQKFIKLLAPFAPFIAEELWEMLGNKQSVFQSKWPEFDSKKIIDQNITIAVQVNGKLRATIIVPKDSDEEFLKNEALKEKRIKQFIGNKSFKTIFVKNKILNFVLTN